MDQCPYCKNTNSIPYLKLRDEFLSKEPFEIVECSSCHLLYTIPRPAPDKMSAYYQSDAYLSHQENKSGLVPKLYESVKSINIRHKLQLATQGMTAGKILDIGCGVGDFLLAAKNKGWDITGIEPSQQAKTIANHRLGIMPLDPSDIVNLDGFSFDVITMWHVLEHVDDLLEQASQIARLLKPNGRLIIAVPNYQSYDAAYYKDKWAAWDVPRHVSHFNQDILCRIFFKPIFNFIDCQGLKWDAYYISYLSEKYLGHSMPLLRGAFRGAISNLKALRTGMYSSLVYRFQK